MLTKLEIYGIAAALILLAAFGWGAYKKHEGVIEERARWEAKVAAATKADLDSLTQAVQQANTIAQTTQDKLKTQQATRVIEKGVIEREIRTDVRYAADCFPDSGRLHWDAISAGRALLPVSPAIPKPDASLPQGVLAPDSGQQGRNATAKPPGR